MKLTEKDIEFLNTLHRLLQHGDLRVERCCGYLRLRGNYGDHVATNFRMTRQGVRWRFQRVIDMYLSAFQTILLVEQSLGSGLREMAIQVSQDRANTEPACIRHGRGPDQPGRSPKPKEHGSGGGTHG